MNKNNITEIERHMLPYLDNKQMQRLHIVLVKVLPEDKAVSASLPGAEVSARLQAAFFAAKRVEGCSARTLKFYETTLKNVFKTINKDIRQITTEDLRSYLDQYANAGRAGKITIDNVRRILSSFFNWLEEENYIIKSPVKRIHRVRVGKNVKATFSDEMIEQMRDACTTQRDVAIIDLLASSGIRVGELVRLNKDDINFNERECIVFGKGNKERRVYFDARTKLHLQKYIDARTDDNPALFVTLTKPVRRLQIPGVEIMVRKLGARVNIARAHPHKFRRTLATTAIGRGMPVEQVQHLLGHQNLDTTMQYAMVKDDNVKLSHQKLLS